MAKTYYVDCTAKKGNGSKKKPFATISEAALISEPGDEVIVADGIYRENVDPKNGGTEKARITYRAEHPGKAVITGAEQVKSWARHEGTVWVTTIKNSKFKEKNPYTDLVYGDWYWPMLPAHRGEVFLNDKSLYEVATLEEVMNPKVYKRSWDPAFTIYTWYTEQSGDYTRIYANFQGADPNVENVEITFRSNCFYPQKEGIGYITLDGFKICKAACQWAPPTAYQEGMVGPHWSKGWIIENCEISHAKCSGISLGKYLQPENDNKWSKFGLKDGTQTERDAICQAQNDGWSKETVGSHIIRNCDIHDCGQTGIVGHMGGVFSIIENNHFHHINNKQNLGGAEIGGIKLHAAIDVTIRNNRFDHCTRGLWLDWQAQGTRVTQNIFYDNNIPNGELEGAEGAVGEDIFVEVSHGPTLIDNNLLLSDCSLRMCTQGFAVVHNFIAGSIVGVGQGVCNGTAELPSPRYTPYHVPHSTNIAGFMTILHGDARFYNNIFVQQPVRPVTEKVRKSFSGPDAWAHLNLDVGTCVYDGYMTADEYFEMLKAGTDRERFYRPLPVYTGGNVYFNGAKPCDTESDAYVDSKNNVTFSISEDDGKITFESNCYDFLPDKPFELISTASLGEAFEPEEPFENPDGTPITFDTDLYGNKRKRIIPGPIAR